MDEYNITWAILFLIAIVVPPQKTMGARGFMNNWDSSIEKPAKRLPPPKLIQIRYKISNAPINIITYLTFLIDFAVWIMFIVMLPCLLFLKGKLFDTAFIIFVIVYLLINLPIGIARTVCTIKIAKKQKVKLQTEQYVAMRSAAEALVILRKARREYKEIMRKNKEYTGIIAPFLRDFERCLKTKKGIRYIPEDNLKWLIDKIIPKYQKHLAHNVLSTGPTEKILTIYLTKRNESIIQVPIKKD